MALRNLPPYRTIDVSFLGEQKVAASKRHNYLFIAVRSQIRVYTPKYPYQTIPNTPAYTTLTSAASPRATAGFIDQRDPHAINSITVGELGFEEVLVSAHDDGDVCAWYTRDLRRLAFRESVGVSAWGVALHKERRLLAVSANTHVIKVFELAIGRREEDEVFGEKEEEEEDEECGSRKRRRRRRRRVEDGEEATWTDSTSSRRRRRVKGEIVKTLVGHNHNIPNISFLDDPTGRWLVGTSIDGVVILWDVNTERAVEKCQLGYPVAGWSVLFLKPQAFKPVSNLHEALGISPITEPRKVPLSTIRTLPTDYYDPPANRSRSARAWDISPPFQPPANPTPSLALALLHQLDEGYDDEEEVDYSEDESVSTEDGEVEAAAADIEDEETEVASYYSFGGAAGFTSARSEEHESSSVGPAAVIQDSEASSESREKRARETSRSRPTHHRPSSSNSHTHPSSSSSSSDDEEDQPAQPPISFVFSTTEQNCHLLTLAPALTPTVICRTPLHQPHPLPSLQYLGNIDRLNMVHSIPDLSLVIAASQKGRAAIFRLTRVGDVFCMRLDTVLPREDEVEVGDRGRERRPAAALLGVAVGPVQERRGRCGGVGVWARRRWRLMMVYMDGTVVSYELGREEGVVTVEGIEGGGVGSGGVGGFVMV